jgi:ATP-dependent DNA helicase RecG
VTVHDASPLTDFTDESASDAFEKKMLTFGRNSEEIRKKFGLTALEILKVIMEQPDSTAQIMAKRIKVSSRTIEKNMAKLKEEGIIIRTGSTKKGYWEIQKLIMK